MSHRNETGATTTLATTALPATYSFKCTLKTGDTLSILPSLPGSPASAGMKTFNLFNGKEVKCATGRGVNAQAVRAYVMGA